MDQITINSKITAEDYKKVTLFGAFGKNKMTKFLLLISLPVGLLQIAEVLYSKTIAFPLAFYSSIVMLSLLVLMFLLINWDINRFIKNDKVVLNTYRTIYIDENGLTSLQPDLTQVSYGYDKFLDAYEINGFFLIYVNKVSGVILAKRDFKEGDVEKLRELLKSKFQKRFVIRGTK